MVCIAVQRERLFRERRKWLSLLNWVQHPACSEFFMGDGAIALLPSLIPRIKTFLGVAAKAKIKEINATLDSLAEK
jgi:hypothetical protein